MICCSYCGTPTSKRYAFRLTEIGERPATYACAQCGGSEGQPAEILHAAQLLDELNACTVRLSPEELSRAIACGRRMREDSLSRRNLKVSQRSDLYVHIVGAVGEAAVCQLLGFKFVCRVGSFRAADLPGNIEVRTRTAFWQDLKVREDDDDSRRIVLVICPDFRKPVRVCGWIGAREGKALNQRIDPAHAGQPFLAVFQDQLRPMRELKAILRKERAHDPSKPA